MINNKIKEFLANNKNLPTPFVVFDLSVLESKYAEFKNNFNDFDVFYAVKCNPAVEILKTLDSLGSCFDVASIEEIELCLSVGISPDKLSWGSTIKKTSLIEKAYSKGVNIYAFDSEEELEKIAKYAPKSKVYCRILVNNKNALWPLSDKFGCSEYMAEDLMIKAKKLNLHPFGISFHTGSQQLDLQAWDVAISKVANIFNSLKEKHNINLEMVNIGGGYPAYGYITPYKFLNEYKSIIDGAFVKYFPHKKPKVFAEPGRFLVADAGVLKSEVVLVSKKDDSEKIKWVYLDIGVFGGLAETLGESIKYKIITDKDNTLEKIEVALAGPTCDGADIMYKNYKYSLPKDLQSGDSVYIISTGAYTTTYSSVCFNGFKPLKDYYVK